MKARNVSAFTLAAGDVVRTSSGSAQWLEFIFVKKNGESFSLYLLCREYPGRNPGSSDAVLRYIVREEDQEAVEYRHVLTDTAVLPSLGAWTYLLPRPGPNFSGFPEHVSLLGHKFRLVSVERGGVEVPSARIVRLLPEVLVGVPHNSRTKDDRRRYDDTEYEYVKLTKEDFDRMIQSGLNCFFVDEEQLSWIERSDVFYWGVPGDRIRFPEFLYRSNYLGPRLFLDEPAVCTRDHVIRPRLERDVDFRRSISPQVVLEEFKKYFSRSRDEASTLLARQLASRDDIDLGDMHIVQTNLYTWETMVSTALYQLGSSDSPPPRAFVFEPPGRVGTLRTLPEIDMTYGCQIPPDDPKNLMSIICGFLRGASRTTGRRWGISIYGQVDRSDAPWFMTHAYDLGAEYFFFWDSYYLACVPFGEYLALSKHLKNHVGHHPDRNLSLLRESAEVAILLPPGYNLGHVDLGRGNLWGLESLNLERRNHFGVPYRKVMSAFFQEVEKCIREGTGFDLMWDLDGFDHSGYREVVRILENGQVEVTGREGSQLLSGPRTPARPGGRPPALSVEVDLDTSRLPTQVTCEATVRMGSSPVWYTAGADRNGVYHNDAVMWELFGPEEWDYRFLNAPGNQEAENQRGAIIRRISFQVQRSGVYRLRAATVDLCGRSAVVWKTIKLGS